MVQSQTGIRILHWMKYLGLALIALGIPTIIIDNSPGSELPLLVGLFMLLVATEKDEDERSIQVKTTSLYIAFILSYATKLIVGNLASHQLISFNLVEINHFLILMLTIANVVYYGRMYVLKF
jgi:hypothetical protein